MADFVSPNRRVSADAVQSPDTSDVVADITHLAQSEEQDTPMTAAALRLVETRGEYHASTNRAAPNAPSSPMRGFTQVDNAYFDGLFGVVSPSAYYCLMYIVRSTIGYRNAGGARREHVRLSFKQLGQELGLSRNTALKAMQELETARIVGSDADERARTQIRAYFLLPIECWNREALHAHSSRSSTSAKTALVVSKIGLVEPQTSAKFGHLINKERKKVSKEIDANASSAAGADAVTPVPSIATEIIHPIAMHPASAAELTRAIADMPAQSSGSQNPPGGVRTPRKRAASKPRERKMTAEQYAAHQAEQGWCAEQLAELCRRLDVKMLPKAGQQKAAAKWFYDELRTVPDGAKRLWQCYDLTKREPFWQHRPLYLSDLMRPFPEYRSDPKGYRARIEDANKPKPAYAARAAPHAPVEPPQYQPSSAKDIWK